MEILKVAKYLQLFFFLLFRKVSKASFFLIFALAPPPQKHSNAVPSCTVRKLGNCRTGEREGTSDHRVKRRWKTRKERFLQKARQQWMRIPFGIRHSSRSQSMSHTSE
jgi:hypothetical protein